MKCSLAPAVQEGDWPLLAVLIHSCSHLVHHQQLGKNTYLERVAICSPWLSPVAYMLADTSNPESNSITHLMSPSFGEMYPM